MYEEVTENIQCTAIIFCPKCAPGSIKKKRLLKWMTGMWNAKSGMAVSFFFH